MNNIAIFGTDKSELKPWGLYFETSEGWELLDTFMTLEEAEKAYKLEMEY